jgi:aspartyl protease family protein
MGLTYVDIQVSSVANLDAAETIQFLVDSGASYSVVPAETLTRLGITPISREIFRLADGRRITRPKGVAVFRFKERVGGADVIFGEPGDANLLGVFTLEALGLSLDPLKRELNELPMML